MNRKFVILGLAIPLIVSSAAFQTKPKPAQKPPATAPTKGAAQMPGDKGKVGTTFQISDKGDELHFRLDSAELETRAKTTPDAIISRGPDRLLILSFAVQKTKAIVSFPIHGEGPVAKLIVARGSNRP